MMHQWNRCSDMTRVYGGIMKRTVKQAFLFLAGVLAAAAGGAAIGRFMAAYQVLPQTQPAKAYAKESLGGIRQIVERHGEDEPYVILDIVPGRGTYTYHDKDYDISIGTMGYLVQGQAPIEKDLENIFTNHQEEFYEYADRVELAEAVMPDFAGNGFVKAFYEEAYEGTGQELSGTDGWIKILDSISDVDIAVETVPKVPKGRMFAKWQKHQDGESKEGYDYHLSPDSPNRPAQDSVTETRYYQADQDGIYQVTFENPQENISGYQVSYVSEDWKNSSDATSVYRLVDGAYYYAGTVKELKLSLGIYEEEDVDQDEKPEEEKKEPDTEKVPEENPGNDPADNVDDGDTEDSGHIDDDSNTDPGDETDADNTDSDAGTDINDIVGGQAKWQKLVNDGDGSVYCIVTFSYVEDLEEAQELYQVRSVQEYTVREGEAPPEDTYSDSRPEEEEGKQEGSDNSAENVDVDYIFVYAGPGQGEYKLTRVQETEEDSKSESDADTADGEEDSKEDTEDGSKEEGGTEVTGHAISQDTAAEAAYVEVQNAPVYMKCCKGNDWLERYVFHSLDAQDNRHDAFAVEVWCVPAGEVEEADINDADLVFLEDGLSPWLNTNVQVDYRGEVDSLVISGLLYDVVAELKPVIVAYGIIEDDHPDHYQDDTYQKLAKIFLKKDLSGFYYEMDRSGNLAENLLMNVEKESEEYPDKTDNDYNYVNRNVYIIYNEQLVSEDFGEAFDDDKAEAGFGEVLAAIRAENMTLSEDDRISEEVSKAMAMQYIINFSAGLIGEYKDLSILELQPTANAVCDIRVDENEDSVVLYWQRDDRNEAGQQILRSSRKIETDITVKSVAEFNGGYQDINNRYHMIFIGLDGQNLYRERDKEGNLMAVYNDESLNGKVYHTGDRTASGDGRYDANDMTRQKKEALLDYLRAGYPVVVENDCFTNKSARDAGEKHINKEYIAGDTQMYQFLKEALALNDSEEYEDKIGLYTIEDVHSSAMFMAQLNIVRPKIDLCTPEDGADTPDVIVTQRTPEGEYRGEIVYQISSDRAGDDKSYRGSLTKHFYLDMNYDGVFMPDEEIYDYLEEDMDGGGRISVTFQEACFGIVPWKLEISDDGNHYRRDAVQGYFTISGEGGGTIRVLQVLDDTELTAANIKVQYEETADSMLGYYLRQAQTLLNMEFEIETVTPAVLADRLLKKGAYLSGWDVVVLGFGDSGYPGDIVAAAVNDYISAGGGVLVSCAGAADKGGLGILPQYLGLNEGSTYGALGIHSDEKYRYQGLSSDMFDKLPGLYTENINEGTISKWPYQIGSIMTLGENTQVKAPEYLLDMDAGYGEAVTHATAWYTLNQSGEGTNAYNISPRDARNNYYVYSKGNVVYVGQSVYPYLYDPASGVAPDPHEKGAGETMLFVNALFAAYNSGVHRSGVSIVAGFTGAAGIESITVPFDVEFKALGEAEGGILDETVDVYFQFTDNNIAFDKVTEITFYYENGNRPADSDPKASETCLILPDGGINTTDFMPFTSAVWMVENHRLVEVTGTELKQGKVYRIKAPVVALQTSEDETADIYVLLRTRYTRSGQTKEVLCEDSVTLTRAQMFLLE